MNHIKTFKKGEALFKEGEKATHVYLIQSGSVSLQLSRQKQNIELCTLGGMQIAGEHALSGQMTNPHSAVSLAETKAIELPIDGLKTQIEGSSQLIKFLAKSLADKMKVVMREFQSMKLERDNTPCPPDQTAKIFGTLFHVARTKGELRKDPKAPKDAPPPAGAPLVVSWPLMKQYSQRVFLESPKRLEQAVNIFVKLGLAKYEIVKNEDEPGAPDEIGFVHFFDLPLVEQFFEFYQYYYFKGGKTELLKTDERVMQMTAVLVEIAASETPDRHGVVRLDYTKVVEKFKASMGLQLNVDHFTLLENKGLFVKRQSTDSGVWLQFELKEFERTLKIWRVLREVERWNEKGSVDPNEPVEAKKAQKAGPACPQCATPFEGTPKFCPECGHKLVQAA